MRKKFREITVDGVKFAWSVKPYRGSVTLNIWDANKKLIHKENYKKDDYFEMYVLEYRSGITPGIVSELIRKKFLNKTSV